MFITLSRIVEENAKTWETADTEEQKIFLFSLTQEALLRAWGEALITDYEFEKLNSLVYQKFC